MAHRLLDTVGVAPIPPRGLKAKLFGGATLAKSAVRFIEQASNGKTCSACAHFDQSGTRCRIVAGAVTFASSCALWERATR